MTKPRKTREEFLAALQRKLDARRERVRRKRQQDPEYFRQKQREFQERNPGYSAKYGQQYRQKHPAKVAAKGAESRALKHGRLPACYDFDAVLVIYDFAHEFRKAGFEIHVDHIVPLQHPLVCGLHTTANLRPCTAEGNTKKGNEFPSVFLGYGLCSF